jgi:site-specific recombinase XerD
MMVNISMDITAKNLLKETIHRIDGEYAPSTIRAYRANFEWFIEYCESVGKTSFPANPVDIANYIAHLVNGGLKSASIRIAVASISCIHKLNQVADPTLHPDVKIELRRMHRKLGRSCKQALGITKPILEKMIGATKWDLRGLRDRALLLVAYDSLCRRSELAAFTFDDMEFDNDGFPNRIRIRRSKSDQEAIGKIVRIDIDAQKAIKDWISAAKISSGFLFRGVKNNGDIIEGINPAQINRIYKKIAKNAGLTNSEIKNISGHSFRVGRTQDLIKSGATFVEIITRGRWVKTDTAIRYGEFTQL